MSTFKTYLIKLSLIGDTFAFSVVLFLFSICFSASTSHFFCRILYHFLLKEFIPRISVLAHFSSSKTSPGFHLILSFKLSSISWWPPSSTSFSAYFFFSTHDLSQTSSSLFWMDSLVFSMVFPVSSLEQTPAPTSFLLHSSSAVFLVWAKVIFLKYKSRLSKSFIYLKHFYPLSWVKPTENWQKIKKKPINRILCSIKLGKICSSKLQHMKNMSLNWAKIKTVHVENINL